VHVTPLLIIFPPADSEWAQFKYLHLAHYEVDRSSSSPDIQLLAPFKLHSSHKNAQTCTILAV
jgi:hypothetical protein